MRDDATRVDDAHLRARVAGFCLATHDAVSRKHKPVATSTQKSVTAWTMAVLGLYGGWWLAVGVSVEPPTGRKKTDTNNFGRRKHPHFYP
jgi:hypothetical protein